MLPLLLLTLLPAATRVGEPEVYSGHYTVDWEVQAFRACGGDAWWVANPGPLLGRWREVVGDAEYGTIFVTVRADVTDPGRFGHLGRYRRAMAVREVIEARPAADGDCDRRAAE